MKIKIIHPLWTHLPAVAAFVVLIIFVITAGPLPARAPVHFGFSGLPNRYGSPWESLGVTIGLSLLYICLSIFFDELWARQEKTKSFNWLSFFDDIFVGLMVGVSLGYLSFLESGEDSFNFPWIYFGIVGGSTVLLALVSELMRPYRSYISPIVAEKTQALNVEITRGLKENMPFVYWDIQNPFYVALITVLLPLIMFIAAAISWFSTLWVSILLIVVGLMMIIPAGGQRTLITRENISVRWGLLGLRVLRINVVDITRAELHQFSPLRDFGGYGIRFNREMTAYYLRGTRGVKITLKNGKKRLIGSDHPEQLLAVVQAVTDINE